MNYKRLRTEYDRFAKAKITFVKVPPLLYEKMLAADFCGWCMAEQDEPNVLSVETADYNGSRWQDVLQSEALDFGVEL